MHTTIRHDSTGRAITAYLAAVERPRTLRRVAAYMQLMHSTPAHCVRQALSYLARRGVIVRVGYGRYQRKTEAV